MAILPKRVILEMQPYVCPDEGRHAYVRLDFNENTTGFPAAYPAGLPALHVSAYPEYGQLKDRIGSVFGVSAESLLLTNGSDEGISIVAQTFIEPGEDRAIVSTPCFVVIPHSLRLCGATLCEVPVMKDLDFDRAAIGQALSEGARLAMFASPENPTGALLAPETICKWCLQFPQTLFVIDEAYGEFADSSLVPSLKDFDNLLVIKTFSKAWGMAGLRLGVILANPQLIGYMNRVKLPYSVNAAAVWTANQLLDRHAEILAAAKQVMAEKLTLVSELQRRAIGLDVGNANSILLQAGINAGPLTAFLKGQGVLVRNRSVTRFPEGINGHKPATWGRIRVSVGTSSETKMLLTALDRFNSSYGLIFDLDGTIIDVSTSYDQVVLDMVQKYSGQKFSHEQLQELRAEGGFNDDWEATVELLKRRGKTVALADIAAEGLDMYFRTAHEKEFLLCDLSILERLSRRHPLFVVTGRSRKEYEDVWGQRLNPYFKHVSCLYDLPDKAGKPAPDYLLHLMQTYKLVSGAYIGNAVDDMQAARAAGIDAIGITATQPAQLLREAGAQITLPSVDVLAEVFML